MNKWIGIGRLTKVPELRKTTTGKSVASFSLAIDDGFGDKKSTDFIDIVAWDKTAENCAKFLAKGAKVAVVGKIKKRSYENKDGQKVWITEVHTNEVEFVESKPQQAQPQTAAYPGPDFSELSDGDGELPF